MKTKMILAGILWLFTHQMLLSQQDKNFSDTSVLELSTFLQIVKHHHPLAKQADLQLERAEYQRSAAWGAFDPEWISTANQKYFAGDKYYSHIQSGIKIPTWFGIELNAGYRNNEGYYLNPESTLPETGIFFGSISVPLGKDLVIDKRRTELEKANYYITAGELQRELLLNDLLYESATAYWTWFETYNRLLILDSTYTLALKRFEAVKQAFVLGDRPSVDTLEAFLQLQNRSILKTQAEAELAQNHAQLSVFLWYNGAIPVELETFMHPPVYKQLPLTIHTGLTAISDSVLMQHPEIKLYGNKTDLAKLDRRYHLEQLKPQIDLKYEALSAPLGQNPLGNYSGTNYAWGLEFSFPLLLQEERARLQMTGIALEEINYQQQLKKEQIRQKLIGLTSERTLLFKQYELQQQAVASYRLLCTAEETLFNNGESSLFMINSRENDLVQSQLKLVELIVKYQKNTIGLLHTQANIYQSL